MYLVLDVCKHNVSFIDYDCQRESKLLTIFFVKTKIFFIQDYLTHEIKTNKPGIKL